MSNSTLKSLRSPVENSCAETAHLSYCPENLGAGLSGSRMRMQWWWGSGRGCFCFGPFYHSGTRVAIFTQNFRGSKLSPRACLTEGRFKCPFPGSPLCMHYFWVTWRLSHLPWILTLMNKLRRKVWLLKRYMCVLLSTINKKRKADGVWEWNKTFCTS